MTEITMQTPLREVAKLAAEIPGLQEVIGVSGSKLARLLGEGKTEGTVGTLGERIAYNTMISLNLTLKCLEAGQPVLYRLRQAGEAETQETQETQFLGFFNHPGRPCCIVLPDVHEGALDLFTSDAAAIAYELDRLGYNAAVVRYRLWDATDDGCHGDAFGSAGAGHDSQLRKEHGSAEADRSHSWNGRCEDIRLAAVPDVRRVVEFVTGGISGLAQRPYALFGFGEGGLVAGLWGSRDMGFRACGLPAPGVIVCAFAPVGAAAALVDPEYPPVYLIHGMEDQAVPIGNSECMAEALKASGVEHRFVPVPGAPHGFGKGHNTAADGWLADALNFWKNLAGK